MNILMTESSPNWGGQEQRLVREAAWLREQGHQVVVACRARSALATRLWADGLPFRPMEFRLTDAPALFRLAREAGADVIHTRSSADTTCALWARLRGIPVVRSRHMTIPERLNGRQKWLYRHGNVRIVAASRHIKDGLVNEARVDADAVDVIGEGVDLGEFSRTIDGSALRREWGVDPSAPLFGVIGMLRGEKGQRHFVNAAVELLRSVPRARFVIVGDGTGNYADNLRAKVRKNFPGPRAPLFLAGFRRDIPQVTAALDVLVVPSTQEAQTLVIPQAFAMAKPVVATKVGGIPEIVQNGRTGVLVEPNDGHTLAEGMKLMLEEPGFARELAGAGHEFARRELPFDKKMTQLLTTYGRVLAS
jgi:glycosyltransferase involved in cell wall biosynthesis